MEKTKYTVFIATVSDNPTEVISGGTFATREEADRCAKFYNMGADYSHMRVFQVTKPN